MDQCGGRAGQPACRNWGQINLHARREEGKKAVGREGGRKGGGVEGRASREEGRREVGRER